MSASVDANVPVYADFSDHPRTARILVERLTRGLPGDGFLMLMLAPR